uniref:Eukaryotic translation initiation factor 3 subunit H n=1 Tax=Lygus hesperus TaxID=30085 RepID=A0A146KUQ9_LYGHE
MRNELFGTYQVGQFVIAGSTFNIFPIAVVNQLMNLCDHGQPMVFLSYDPFSTAILGKPALHAYVPTQEYLAYHNALKLRKKDVKFSKLVKESNVTAAGVLREVPLQIDVDAYQKLGLAVVHTAPLVNSFSAIQSDAVNNFIEALVNSVRANTETLSTGLEKENKANMHDPSCHNAPLAQRIDTLLLLQHIKIQTQMLESLCNSTLLNTALLRDIE